jgi:hypothetical protein
MSAATVPTAPTSPTSPTSPTIGGPRSADADGARPRRGQRPLFGWAGVGAAVVLTVSLSALGDTPDPHDTGVETASYFADHRSGALLSVALFAPAAILLAWFLAGTSSALLRAGRRAAGVLTAVSGGLVLALLAGNAVVYEALALYVATDAPGAAKPLFVATIAMVPVLGPIVGLVLLTIGIGSWPRRLLPRWWSGVSLLAGVALLPAAGAVADSGFLYADTQQQIIVEVFTSWLVGTGLLIRSGAESSDDN